MNIIQFSKETVQKLIIELKKAYKRGHKQQIRRVYVLMDLSKNGKISEVAKENSISRQTVYDWLKEFIVEGLDSLVYKKPSGREPKLTKTQKAQLIEIIKESPLKAGYPIGCWSSLIVQQLILEKFGVLYNRNYICQLLQNLGFSYQKARFVSDHLDSEKRRVWLEETWPKILSLALERNSMILFGDEVSFAQWGSLSYTWSLVGKQPLVKTAGKRKGYKLFGAIDFFSGNFFFQPLEEGKFNSEKYQTFLEEIIHRACKHIILIQDGARYHTSGAIMAFFEKYKKHLTVFQLPSYSPDYNPIEFLWKKMKKRATHNQYFPEFENLVTSVDTALQYFSTQKEEIKNLMGLYIQTFNDYMNHDILLMAA
jgi:transposase